MTVEQFLAWLEDGPEGARYELVAGEMVAMAPERAAHARLKARIWRALDDQVVAQGLSCEALPDGMTIKIDEHTAYEPDAVLHRGTLPAMARPLYALAVHPPHRVPAALNGFGLWNVLVLVLMIAAYGYPIAQFLIDPSPGAIVHRSAP